MVTQKPGAIVFGGDVNPLETARALARHGIPVTVVRMGPVQFAQHSRSVSDSVSIEPFESNPDPLLALLRHYAGRWRGRVLMPTKDQALETLARNHEELSGHYKVPVPPWPVTRQLLRKGRTHSAAVEAGAPVPASFGRASAALLDHDSLPFPLVLKPANSVLFEQRLGRKLLAVHSRAEFRRALATLAEAGLEADVYDLVPGPDTNYYNYVAYLDRGGQPAAEMVVRKIRKSPPFHGVGRVVTNRVPDEVAGILRRHSLALLRPLGWYGPVSAEFKFDPRNGEFRLIEINGRPALMMGIAHRAGVNIPLLMWREAVHGHVSRVRPNGWKGVWIHLNAEFVNIALYRRGEGLSWRDYLTPYLSPRTFAVWSIRDPLPFACQWFLSLCDGVRYSLSAHLRERMRKRLQAPGDLS